MIAICARKSLSIEKPSGRNSWFQASADSFTDADHGKTQEIALTVYLDDENFPQVEIELYRYDGSHCLAVVDGTSVSLIPRADAMELVEEVQAIVLR